MMHAYSRNKVASEAADERQARLQQLGTNQRERLAAEPDEQRQARLQRIRAQNHVWKHVCVHRSKKWRFLRLAPQCFAFTSYLVMQAISLVLVSNSITSLTY